MSDVTQKLAKVCQAIEGKKGEDILVLDISEISSFTDFFVLCHGHNEKQVQAISDAVREVLTKEEQTRPVHVEGYRNAAWVLLDYLDFVVHIFSEPTRHFYKLEKLWSDGTEVNRHALSA
jgi:ribosome-associated protein